MTQSGHQLASGPSENLLDLYWWRHVKGFIENLTQLLGATD